MNRTYIRLMLHDLMQIIRRQLGSRGFLRHGLDRFHHTNACAAANTLEDAEFAIDHYVENEWSGEPGLDYLRTYGVFQAAYLQQDAARLLRMAFGLDSGEWPEPIHDLRELRNRAIGHPADTPKGKQKPPDTPRRKRKSDPPATFIVRREMSGGSLKTLQIEADGTSRSSLVDLRLMLKAHSEALREWMKELVDELQRREKERRDDIAARGPVSALMPPWWRYALQKIHEASGPDEMSARLARAEVSSLLTMLNAVEAGLRERDIDPPPPGAVEIARAALDRLAKLLPRAAAGNKVELDIAAFATLADRHLSDIATFLKEVDERLKDS